MRKLCEEFLNPRKWIKVDSLQMKFLKSEDLQIQKKENRTIKQIFLKIQNPKSTLTLLLRRFSIRSVWGMYGWVWGEEAAVVGPGRLSGDAGSRDRRQESRARSGQARGETVGQPPLTGEQGSININISGQWWRRPALHWPQWFLCPLVLRTVSIQIVWYDNRPDALNKEFRCWNQEEQMTSRKWWDKWELENGTNYSITCEKGECMTRW